MIKRNIFIGLNDFGADMCYSISSSFDNSVAFSILDEHIIRSGLDNGHNYSYFFPRMELRNYTYMLNKDDRKKVIEWNNNIKWYDNFYNYLCRIDYRFIYECRNNLIFQGHSEFDILAKEIKNVSNNDVIHIVAPYFERSAMAIGFFLAWDIRELYSKQGRKAKIVAHYILPDTPVFPRPTLIERMDDYAVFTAFVKELICINEICNGVFITNDDFHFEIDKRFDSIESFGHTEKLPYDYVCFFGTNKKMIDDREGLNREKLKKELLVNVSNYRKTGIACESPNFRKTMYERYPQFSKEGYANIAYYEILNSLKDKIICHSPHLDFRWNEILKDI